jgi:hypothetical protein
MKSHTNEQVTKLRSPSMWKAVLTTRWPITDNQEVHSFTWNQTQVSICERLGNLTEDQQTALWGSQEFYRAYSSVNGGRKREIDLFEGLR